MSKKIKFVNGQMIEYEIYKLVDCYDPILYKPTQEVDFDAHDVPYMCISLAETLSDMGGLGLSANQVGVPYRICAINMGEKIWMMVNPKIIWKSEDKSSFKEGCLSFPGLYLDIGRPAHIKVRFQAVGGDVIEHEFDGLTATVIQHEIDHLDGICYTKLVSPIKLDQAKRKIKKNLKTMRRATGAA
jgi:peptide deformylase